MSFYFDHYMNFFRNVEDVQNCNILLGILENCHRHHFRSDSNLMLVTIIGEGSVSGATELVEPPCFQGNYSSNMVPASD